MNRRLIAIALAAALVAAACGARLSDEDLAGLNSGGGPSIPGVSIPGVSVPGGTPGVTVPGATPGVTVPASGDPGTADPGTSDPGTADPGTADPGTSGPDPADPGAGGGAPPPAAAGCTSASGVGVKDGTLTLGIVSDRSGPIPGLFESTIKAVNAWVNLVNQQGGICGLQVAVTAFDSKTDSGANRAATVDACSKVFALIGSVSAFDDGGVSTINECGIPDIPAFPTSIARGQSANTFGAFPNGPDWLYVGPWVYYKANFPGLEKAAAMLYTDSAVPKSNALTRIKVLERDLGFNFVIDRAVSPVESNYGPFVADMKSKNVKMASMVSDQSNLSRFVDAFKQQNYQPDVIDLDSSAYDQRFAKSTDGAAEKVLVWLNVVPVEEGGSNQEFQLLQGFMGEVPDYFAVYAWSAARLFQTLGNATAGEMTRASVLADLKAYKTWDGNGLHASHEIGVKKPSPCFVFVKVSGGGFVRSHPASGFDCDSGPVTATG